MILYVNDKNEIKDVDTASDPSLIALEVNDETNPFKDWSIAKICCFKVTVSDGIVTSMSPYVDSELIEHINRLGSEIMELRARIEKLETDN